MNHLFTPSAKQQFSEKTLTNRLGKTGISAALFGGALGLASHVMAVDQVAPGTTAYFDDPIELVIANSGDCNQATNECGSSAVTTPGAAKIGTYVVSTFNTTSNSRATGGLVKTFTVPGAEGDVLDARITGSTAWRGSLYVIDFTNVGFSLLSSLGAKAEAFLRVSVVDVTNPNAPFEVGNDAIADFDCEPGSDLGFTIPIPLVSDGVDLEATIGVCEQESNDTFNFGAKVITGHTYELQLTAICQTTTGALQPTLLSACTFNPSPIAFDLSTILDDALTQAFNNLNLVVPDAKPSLKLQLDPPKIEVSLDDLDVGQELTNVVKPLLTGITNSLIPKIDNGFVSWDYMTVTIDENVTGMIRDSLGETIRLLHTPQGKRTSGPIDQFPELCGDGDCAWAEK